MNPFSKKLKSLRGGMSVEDLASRSGVAASSIYKMEGTAKVRWQTVEKTYGHLFRDAQEHCLLLILWALEQTDHKVSLYEAAETAKCILREEAGEAADVASRFGLAIRNLTPVDADLLLRFANKFASSLPTRQMVKAWMEAIGG
jgi:hypothetical protein